MAEASTESHQATLLRIFERSGDGRLTAGALKEKLKTLAKKSSDPAADAAWADRTLSELIEEGFIAVTGGSKEGPHPRASASYRLTEKGKQHLRPARPEIPDEQLQAQEAFILLQVFRSKERALTRSELNQKLTTKAAVGQLEFDVKAEPVTIDYHLAELVENGCLDQERRGNSVVYRLNEENGPKVLASLKQHDGVGFSMTGETLNALLAAARQSQPAAAASVEPIPAPTSPPAFSRPLVPDDIAKYIDQLQADLYAGKDLIPIHEVRRLVAQHKGAEAASHQNFDTLIKRMLNEDQLDLIAISDNRDATQKQLDDSIPGMNETLFYIVIR